MNDTVYITVRIDYTYDPATTDAAQARAEAQEKVISDAHSHIHTVENGIRILDIENCGENN